MPATATMGIALLLRFNPDLEWISTSARTSACVSAPITARSRELARRPVRTDRSSGFAAGSLSHSEHDEKEALAAAFSTVGNRAAWRQLIVPATGVRPLASELRGAPSAPHGQGAGTNRWATPHHPR